MFNPWAAMNPNQQFPIWGQPATASSFMPPPFAQLFDLGSIIQTIQQAAPNQAASADHMRQLEEMIRTFSASPLFAGLPGAALPQQNPWVHLFNLSNSPGAMPNWQPQGMNAPALGIGREFQEDWTRLTEYRRQYENAAREFSELFEDFVRKASEKFLSSLSEPNGQQDFGSLCRNWIDCCENEFQSTAQTAEYSTRLGKMINACLHLMQHSNRMQEKFARLHGYPTRSELDDLHKKHVLAQARIEALESKLQQLESNLKPKPKSAPRRRRSPKKPDS